MYILRVKDKFSSAHFIERYPGKCSNLHGHNWWVEVVIVVNELNDIGISIDFGDAKKVLKSLTDYLDHKLLNELEEFKGINPTAENISKFIFEKLKPEYEKLNGRLIKVILWETENNRIEYME